MEGNKLAGDGSYRGPGRLVGAGRSADVYALDEHRVLRRYRRQFDVQAEAELMRHLDQAGFPVPQVYDADGPDLVLERLDGRDMLTDLGRRPWLARRHARLLAQVHNRLHQVAAPAGWPAALGAGDKVMHLDLHPGNVMLTSRGPVVIDWSSARAGPPGADVAIAYLIMASSEVDEVPWPVRPAVRTVRATVLRHFLRVAADDPGPHLAAVARYRMKDPNVRPGEAEYLRRVAERAEEAGGAGRAG